MPAAKKKKQRTFALAHRQRLERAAELYLRFCYRNKTAARASEFAWFVGLTPQYLSWLCRQIVGRSLREFLREKQLVFAVRLLRTTPIQIDQIAERAGFGTAGTLYRLFSEAYGMTPGQFRKLKK